MLYAYIMKLTLKHEKARLSNDNDVIEACFMNEKKKKSDVQIRDLSMNIRISITRNMHIPALGIN